MNPHMTSPLENDASTNSSTTPARKPFRFSLRTIFFLVTLLPLILAQIQSAIELSTLRKEVSHLREEAGYFDIKDPTKVYVKALRSLEPMNYRWRIYLPPNISWSRRMAVGKIPATGFDAPGASVSSSSSGSTNGAKLLEVAIRRNLNGDLQLQFITDSGGISQNIQDKDRRWLDETTSCPVSIHQAGSGGVEEFSADEPIELLRMRVVPLEADGTTPPIPERTDGILVYLQNMTPKK